MKEAEKITLRQAQKDIGAYVHRAASRGEKFILVEGSEQLAELGPPPPRARLGELQAILDESLSRLTPEEADDFAQDLEAIRSEQIRQPQRDPWGS